jgi:hypothetical protein
MKNIVRAFVVALVLTGAVASTHATTPTVKTIAAPVQSGLMPIPSCEPGSGGCGINK